ncbi:MAG: hypothetical protein HY460_00780 [Parcubacteria group bacterium]|nr:hypothetical protein [Parcubacteria group bacterium]
MTPIGKFLWGLVIIALVIFLLAVTRIRARSQPVNALPMRIPSPRMLPLSNDLLTCDGGKDVLPLSQDW